MIKILTILFILPLICFSKEQQTEPIVIIGESTEGRAKRMAAEAMANGTLKGEIYDIYILTLTGFRSKESIIAVINDSKLNLSNIYNDFFSKKPDLSGKILLKFTIAENGSVTNADILLSTTEYAEFDEAIKNKVTAYKWKATEGGNSELTIHFAFKLTKKILGHHYNYRDLFFSGPRSAVSIRHIINSNILSLRNLYNEYLKLRPNFNGRVMIKLTIAENGSVANADIVHSETEYAEFDEAIRKELSTWKWKPIKGGNTTVIFIPNFQE